MTKLERRKRNPRKTFYVVIGILLFLLIVAFVGFSFFLAQDEEYSGDSVRVDARVPSRIAAGEDFPLTLTLVNQERVALEDFVLTIQMPDGYTVKSANKSADNAAKNTYSFGTLSPGEEQVLTITGNILGEVGEAQVFGLTFTFRPANFNYQFTEQERVEVTIGASAVTIEIDGPQRIAPETTGTWTVTVTNTSTEELSALRIPLDVPADFTISSSEPELSDEQRWSIDHLAPNAESTLTFTGAFTGASRELQELKATAVVIREGNAEVQAEESILVLLVRPELNLLLERSPESEAAVAPGDRVSVTLSYENVSELELNDVALIITIDERSPVVISNLSTVPAAKGDALTYTWTKDNVPGLASVKPGASGAVSLSVAIPQIVKAESEADVNPQLTFRAKATIGTVTDFDGSGSTEERVLTLPISTVLKVSGEARYYSEEGLPVGSGPIPPEVGKSTTYIISWFVVNSTSDVNDFTVRATIPQEVFWTGDSTSVSAGSVSFDPMSREVVWSVNTIPAGTGSMSPTLSASFAVRIQPKAEDVGTTVVLVDAAEVSGTDTATGKPVTGGVPSMTTDLLHDTRAQGKGVVVVGASE